MNLQFAVMTISDRSFEGKRADESGPKLVSAIQAQGWQVNITDLVPDDAVKIRSTLIKWAERKDINVILTTGGTGFSPRDVTPEATSSILERPAPGLTEAMRSASLKITPHAMLSRSVAGIRGKSLIVNLPGSPKAALENFLTIAPVLEHAIQLLLGDEGAETSHEPAL